MPENYQVKRMNNGSSVDVYPYNTASNVSRTENRISYIEGDTALEVIQSMANTFIAPSGESWEDVTPPYTTVNEKSVMCSMDSDFAVVTPMSDKLELIITTRYIGDEVPSIEKYVIELSNRTISKIIGIEMHHNQLYDFPEIILLGLSNESDITATPYVLRKQNASTWVANPFQEDISLI